MDKLSLNEKKILDVLQRLDNEICSADLADLAEVHRNSIGRYIKKLTEKELIKSYRKQLHNRGFNMITISKKGTNVKIDEIQRNTVDKTVDKTDGPADKKTEKTPGRISKKSEIKAELRTMILNLVVRKIDYVKYQFKSSAEYRNKLCELIDLL